MQCALRHAAELKQHNGWSRKEKKEKKEWKTEGQRRKKEQKNVAWATKKTHKNKTDQQRKNVAAKKVVVKLV